MERFSFGRRGKRNLFTRGTVASVLVLCLVATAAFTACSGEDDEAAEIWNGYFVTQDTDGNLRCLTEEMKVTFKELSGGSLFDSISDFIGTDLLFEYRGYRTKVVYRDGAEGAEFISAAYATYEGGNVKNPGLIHLKKEENGNGYTGFWAGKPNKPVGTEGLICPYYLIRAADDGNGLECTAEIKTQLGTTCYFTGADGRVDATTTVPVTSPSN